MSDKAVEFSRTGEGYLLVLLGALVAFGPLAIDLYLPALPSIAASLNASPEAVQASISVFLAGFSGGMLLYGPLSDRFGRRAVLLSGLALFVVASLACTLSQSITHLLVARTLQAVGGGAASVLARAIVRDVYSPAIAIRKLSIMAMVTAIAPLVAPLLGSILLASFGWRSMFAVLMLWGVLCFGVVCSSLPETLAEEHQKQSTLHKVFVAYGELVRDRQVMGLLLAGGMSFAAMFAYITASPFYFIELHGWTPINYSLLFAFNAAGIFMTNFANSRLVGIWSPMWLLGIACGVSLMASLVLVAAMCLSWPVFVVFAGLFLVVSVTGLMGANCVGLLMVRYPRHAGATAALFGSGQFGLGMSASALVGFVHDGSGRPMAFVIFACTVISSLGYLIYQNAAQAGQPE